MACPNRPGDGYRGVRRRGQATNEKLTPNKKVAGSVGEAAGNNAAADATADGTYTLAYSAAGKDCAADGRRYARTALAMDSMACGGEEYLLTASKRLPSARERTRSKGGGR